MTSSQRPLVELLSWSPACSQVTTTHLMIEHPSMNLWVPYLQISYSYLFILMILHSDSSPINGHAGHTSFHPSNLNCVKKMCFSQYQHHTHRLLQYRAVCLDCMWYYVILRCSMVILQILGLCFNSIVLILMFNFRQDSSWLDRRMIVALQLMFLVTGNCL